jgi:hypothetical protein
MSKPSPAPGSLLTEEHFLWTVFRIDLIAIKPSAFLHAMLYIVQAK